jgi:hypothetical protein
MPYAVRYTPYASIPPSRAVPPWCYVLLSGAQQLPSVALNAEFPLPREGNEFLELGAVRVVTREARQLGLGPRIRHPGAHWVR